MDRRSWLWRRKSSDKSHSGEGDSSGSISSHSERFSDDQAHTYNNVQSPEITSKALPDEDEPGNSIKELLEKLRVKEESVKQHGKVAEEAVTGWEKAENEVVVLKKENEILIQKNLVLEERNGHLDGALKECLRQLRLSREDQEEKISEKTHEWELIKSDLENKLSELQFQLQTAEIKASMVTNLRNKLEASEIERDLSVNAAETASKQRLDIIKKVAKLEAEIRRLKAVARKAATTSSFTDSQSDCGDRLSVIESGSEIYVGPTVEINLMDDFLEMEKLAALPKMETERSDHSVEDNLKAELEAMISKTSELEDKFEKIEMEKNELEKILNRCQNQLKTSRKKLEETELNMEKIETEKKKLEVILEQAITRLENTELKVEELTVKLLEETEKKNVVEATNIKLKKSNERLNEIEVNLVELQSQLATISEEKHKAEEELEATIRKKNEVESQLRTKDLKMQTLQSKVAIMEKEVQHERVLSNGAFNECRKLEDEISRVKNEYQLKKTSVKDIKINQDKELTMAAHKFSECQKTIASLSKQLNTLANFEDFLV